MVDYWFEWLVGVAWFLVVVIVGSIHRDTRDLKRDIDQHRMNTYSKAETIEHIDVRLNPVEERVKDMHKDVREIKDWLIKRNS